MAWVAVTFHSSTQLVGTIMLWWATVPEGIRSAIIGAGATLLAATLGAVVVVMQVGHQARSAIRQNRENEATKLKLQIYERIITNCEDVTDAYTEFNGLVHRAILQIRSARHAENNGWKWSRPSIHPLDMTAQHETVILRTVKLISIIEQWRIVDPRIEVFQTAFNVSIHDISAAFHEELFPLLMRQMPMTHSETGVDLPWTPPSNELIGQLEQRFGALVSRCSNLGGFVLDFQNEMQAILLSSLFKNVIAPRDPRDPQQIVVSLERHFEIQKYFEENTAWGSSNAQAISDADAMIMSKQ